MEIIKIIGIAFLAVIIILILKQYRPEFAMYTSIIAGALILFLSIGKLDGIIQLLNTIATKTQGNGQFFGVLLKMTGFGFLTVFAVCICKDSGVTAIANKVDLGGKIIIVAISVPIISTLLETIIKILP